MIDILLSIYNGSKYIEQQLESLVAQTFTDWRVLMRDDGSRDGAISILKDYSGRIPERFVLLSDNNTNLGPCQSFSRLMVASTAPYIMFCDQDDVWLPNKVESTLAAMRQTEREHGCETPILVHTDLTVTDEDLNLIADSFWRYQAINPQLIGLNRILLGNVVTGNTIMINRRLVDLACPIPSDAIMHDWWIAIIASALGCTVAQEESDILYRQHDRNKLGAVCWSRARVLSCFVNLSNAKQAVVNAQNQAGAFLQKHRNLLAPEQIQLVSVFSRLAEKAPLTRRYLLLKHGLLKNNFTKNLGLLLVI